MKHSSIRFFIPVLLLVSVMALAASVMLSWLSGSVGLIQLHPEFAPMQFNTALGLFIGALCILFLATRLEYHSTGCGLAISLLGVLTLSEYILHVDIGIDELFVDGYVLTQVSHPGRMAPNTALCFIFFGAALFWRHKKVPFLILMTLVSLLSVPVLIGYMIGEEYLYGMGGQTHMALHTSICICLLVAALLIIFFMCRKVTLNFWDVSPAIIGTFCLIITVFSWSSSYEFVVEQDRKYFDALVHEKTSAMRKRFHLYEQALLGGVGFVQGSDYVTLEEWRAYTKAIQIDRYLKGSNGIGYIEVVMKSEKNEFLTKIREGGHKNFVIQPEMSGDVAYITKYIEPFEINQEVFGLNNMLFAEEKRRKAAERARDEGRIILTKKIHLVQDDEKLSGFLLLAPVYAKDKRIDTVELRQKHLEGWVYSPFMARKYLASISDITENKLNVVIYDGREKLDEHLIFKENIKELHSRFQGLEAEVEMEFAGQIWTLIWRPTKYFSSNANNQLPKIIAIGGGFTTVLFTALFYFLSRLYGESAKQRLEAEESLLQEKRMLELAEQTARLGHWHYNQVSNHLIWSEQVYNIHGVTEKNYTPDIESAIKFYHKDDRERIERVVKNALENHENYTFEARIVRRSGEVVSVRSIGMPLFDDNEKFVGIFGILQDSSIQEEAARERENLIKKLEIQKAQLKESEQFLQLIMNHNPDFIFVKDEQLRIIQANETFLNMMFSKEMRSKVIGKTAAEPFDEEEADLFFKMDRKALKEGYLRYKETITLYNGTKIVLDTQKICFQDSKNKKYILCLSKDITQQEKLNILKDEFVSAVNHELRTPLTSISASLDLLKLRLDGKIDKKCDRMLELSYRNCERLMLLVNDILDIEKITAGKVDYQFERLELNHLLAEAVEQNLGFADKYGVQFKFKKDSNPIYAKVDRARFHQVISNLLSNAAKFSSPGQDVTIVLKRKSARRVNILVVDQGEGIPDSFQAKIFDKFSQAAGTGKRQHTGTGLGLAITKSIVEAFKGSIVFESERGKGTQFTITLPAYNAPKEKKEG